MKNLVCAICGENTPFEILYPANFKIGQIDKNLFSARRIPDRCHYRIVHCRKCGLIFSSPILEEKVIRQLYKKSELTYNQEIKNLKKTYGRYLREVMDLVSQKNNLLEIGCGNGFLLEEALRAGFKHVWGVEPSIDAVNQASHQIKPFIKTKSFQRNLFRSDFFDVVCFFQTLDHIMDPNKFLNSVYKVLKSDGLVFCIVHNTDSFLAKILGEKTPIYDIEHIYLFNNKTLKLIFEKNHFEEVRAIKVVNEYSLSYWLKLLPIGKNFKEKLDSLLSISPFNRITLRLKAGNIGFIARKI